MDTIIILDFGSQYTQLIARKLREMSVYCEIHPFNKIPALGDEVKGVIFSGSPYSCLSEDAPVPDMSGIKGRLPLLAVCYGAQYLVKYGGGSVQHSKIREYGRANLQYVDSDSKLLKGIPIGSQVWMSHGDTIERLPDGYRCICSTESVKYAGYQIEGEPTYAIQFHPEVHHSVDGDKLLKNFVVGICGCSQSWTAASFIESTVSQIRAKVGDDKVILGLSGGVDSTVAAVLLNKAIGHNLQCIFVDNGLLRKNEFAGVLESYKGMGLKVVCGHAKERFYSVLAGVTDPEKKRKAIGKTFIDVFDAESKRFSDAKWLAQGTIYPDVIESSAFKGPSQTIKSHHNVGGLPDYMKLQLVEPLRSLFKDEVRRVGQALGIKQELIGRHPFPGPGLAIRILGDVTPEKVAILQEVDDIFIQGLRDAGLYEKVWQAGAILLPIQSVGVMGDERTYERVVALRAVESVDGMTADWCHLPYDFLAKVSNDIINKVRGVNRVCYDISSKPPATIEWE
ncbi:MAG: glutamine-hydrolyzing GMP synthase [Bacteroidales bacterium]|nr:glutamine-hydrolyzing GMP synthase [Candidatus Colimorpha onthohippi]